MPFSPSTCHIIILGYTFQRYHTHSHIHHALYIAFKHLGRDVQWLDTVPEDISNTLFITNHDCASQIPRREDCFYVIHGLNDHAPVRELFEGYKRLSWNVYHDFSSTLGMPEKDYPRPPVGVPLTQSVFLDTDVPFYPLQRHMDFRWATDLLPDQIEANKPTEMLSLKQEVINYVGTLWFVNQNEIAELKRAAEDDGVKFNMVGAGQKGVLTIEENVQLVRNSYMAPAISGSHHLTEGYAPCRIFKNISYGQFGITNSKRVNDIFGGKLIYNANPYHLYYDAKEQLERMPIERLHELMDIVKEKHTYLNRINNIFEAINYLL